MGSKKNTGCFETLTMFFPLHNNIFHSVDLKYSQIYSAVFQIALVNRPLPQ